MDLARIESLVKQLNEALGAAPTQPPQDVDAPFGRDLAGNPKFAPAYDACRSMWEEAQRQRIFSIFIYIGPGIRQGAAQMDKPHKPDLRLIEDAIVALGRSPWGQGWLQSLDNRATVSAEYVRKFGFRPVVRKPDGTLHEYE